MTETTWGQVDILWTVIFILIIVYFMYSAVMIFTDNRPYIPSSTLQPIVLDMTSIDDGDSDDDSDNNSDDDSDEDIDLDING